MLQVDISLPEIEELHKLVAEGQDKGFLTYDEIVSGLEKSTSRRSRSRSSTPT